MRLRTSVLQTLEQLITGYVIFTCISQAVLETMVSTRRMGQRTSRGRPRRATRASEDAEGTKPWFRTEHGLNATGFIPGTNLMERHCSRAEYVAFWGPKNLHNGTRYKRKVSPRMVRRIRYLFQRVFQKPIGRSDAIPYHFGRGLLAERKGIPIDWAGYARKMTHRGTGDLGHLDGGVAVGRTLTKRGKPFVFTSMETLRRQTRPEQWPKNEVGSETDGEEGRDSDWEVNVFHETLNGEEDDDAADIAGSQGARATGVALIETEGDTNVRGDIQEASELEVPTMDMDRELNAGRMTILMEELDIGHFAPIVAPPFSSMNTDLDEGNDAAAGVMEGELRSKPHDNPGMSICHKT